MPVKGITSAGPLAGSKMPFKMTRRTALKTSMATSVLGTGILPSSPEAQSLNLEPIEAVFRPDPYANWFFGTGYKYNLPTIRSDSGFMTGLIEWQKTRSAHHKISEKKPSIIKPIIPETWKGDGSFQPAWLPVILPHKSGDDHSFGTSPGSLDLSSENRPPAVESASFRLNLPIRAGAVFSKRLQAREALKPLEDRTEPLAIVAVIDDAIPFAHQYFRNQHNRSRVDYCWLMAADAREESTVRFGREYSASDIDGLIATHDDEDALYRHAGAAGMHPQLASGLMRESSHGSMVAGIACGFSKTDEHFKESEKIRTIFVQLPGIGSFDTSGFGTEMFMISALHYIFARADDIAKAHGLSSLPLYINLSYGISGGPQNGSSVFEQASDELLAERRRLYPNTDTQLVMPAGNHAAGQMHARLRNVDFEGPGFWSKEVTLRCQPNDRTSSYLEIWIPELKHDVTPTAFQLSIKLPHGEGEMIFPTEEQQNAWSEDSDSLQICQLEHNGAVVGQVSMDKQHGGGLRFLLAIAPTEPENQHSPAAPAGNWRIKVKKPAQVSLTSEIKIFVQRDLNPGGYAHGARQSYLIEEQYDRYSERGDLKGSTDRVDDQTMIWRQGSINGLGTGQHSLLVGGTVKQTNKIARYSCIQSPGDTKIIEKYATSDRSRALPGVIAAGCRSGSAGFINGTSAAAPAIVRQFILNQLEGL